MPFLKQKKRGKKKEGKRNKRKKDVYPWLNASHPTVRLETKGCR